MATIELNDDVLYTAALPAGARLFGAQSAAATEPTSFGREAIYNYVSAALAPVASSGSATDLTSGTLPLGRLHGRLQDIANVPTWSQGDIIYYDGSNLTRLEPGTSGQFLKTLGAGANPVWATPSGGGGGGSGDLLSTNNLSDVASASTARTNLGLAIGTHVQAYDAQLDEWSTVDPSTDGKSLVSAADYAAMRALLDLEVGTDFLSPAAIAAAYQPLDATLTALAGVTVAADKLVYATGADTFSTTDFTSVARTLVNQTTQALMRTTGLGFSSNGSSLVAAADYAAMKALLDLEIGTDVQAYNARLADIAGASWAQGDVVYYNGSNLVRLAAGTNGHFLKTQGAGANPTWAAASGSGAVATDAIWDAKGDLAVGTGADTASRLAAGTNGQVLTADSGEATGLKWTTVSGTGDVTAASSFGTDNRLVRSDGTGKGVQASGITVDDSDVVSGVTRITASHASDYAARFVNTQDSASLLEVARFEGDRATPTDGDSMQVGFYLSNDAGTQIEAARMTWTLSDVTAGTEDSALLWMLYTGGSPEYFLRLEPTTLSPASNNLIALGSTSVGWADLHLASGGVINWANGEVTLTETDANTLTLAGGTLVLPASGLQVGSSNPFSDSAGTLTLQNVDALDATTEATIETAIDTLANLGSIQGVAFTFGAYAATLLNNANEAAFKAAVNLEANTDFYAPSGTDVAVADGGTGRSTGTTAYALIATGTTATGAQQTLAAGATTEILVGGGTSALPVWTTATGSGAPVRATSPTLVTPTIGSATGTNLTLSGYVDLAEISTPSDPSANVGRFWVGDSQSKTVPFFTDPASVETALDIRTGWVQMYRTSDAGADPSANPATWVLRAPDGSYVSTSGTTTQGVAEALTYIAANGYNLFINGGGGINSSDVDVATIHSTSGIDFAPMFKQAVVARGVTFNFGGSATYGFKVDSMMMSMIDFRTCQIVCGTSTYDTGVWLRPRTANAVDPAIAITASDILLGSVINGKSASVNLLIDSDEGPILDGNFIEIREPNGTGNTGSDQAGYGVRIIDDATNVVKGNTIRILDAHGHGTASVAIGSSTTNGANIHSNFFDIHADPDTGATGLDLYGAYNEIIVRVNDDEGSPTTGINIRSSAVYNLISAPRLEASTKISDASAGFTNLIEGEGVRYGGSFYIGTLSSISTVAGSGGSVASRIQFHSTGADSAVTTWRWSADAAGPRVIMSKSRGASVGTQTVVQSGDVLGEIVFAGSDGTDMEPGAAIRAEVNATPGAGDMPAKIVFSTTSDGAEAVTDRVAIDSSGLSVGDVALTPHIAQNSQSAAYTLVLSDAQKQIYHPGSDNNARTFTIPANSSVAYPIGTCLTFINAINTVTIAITSDTLTLAGSGSSGSRTLAANGWATAVKVASTSWMISGVGLT